MNLSDANFRISNLLSTIVKLYAQTMRPYMFLSFPFFSFFPVYRFRDTSFGLLGVPYCFRAQIFADTPLNVQRRSEGGASSRNFGSPQICPRQIFAYWYAGSAFAPRVFPLSRTPFMLYRRLLRLLRVGFLRV